MEQEVYKPKLRITTLSENGTPFSDRLVDAYTEMNSGPKVQHNGPIRVEVTLTNKQGNPVDTLSWSYNAPSLQGGD